MGLLPDHLREDQTRTMKKKCSPHYLIIELHALYRYIRNRRAHMHSKVKVEQFCCTMSCFEHSFVAPNGLTPSQRRAAKCLKVAHVLILQDTLTCLRFRGGCFLIAPFWLCSSVVSALFEADGWVVAECFRWYVGCCQELLFVDALACVA